MNLWTHRLTILIPSGGRGAAGAEVKSFIRSDSCRCALAHDNDYWRATIAGPVEADAPILVCPVVFPDSWVEFPAGSGEVYQVVSRRVYQHGCLRVVHLGLARMIGAEVRDA